MLNKADDDERVRKDVKGGIWIAVPVLAVIALAAAALFPEFKERTETRLAEAQGDLAYAVDKLTDVPQH